MARFQRVGMGVALVAVVFSASSAQGVTFNVHGYIQGRGKFDCIVAHIMDYGDGSFIHSPSSKWRESGHLNRFRFSEQSGDFYWPELDKAIHYTLKQSGGQANGLAAAQNDLVAVADFQGRASFSIKALRIRTWSPVRKEGGLLFPFLLFDEDEVGTGFCRSSS